MSPTGGPSRRAWSAAVASAAAAMGTDRFLAMVADRVERGGIGLDAVLGAADGPEVLGDVHQALLTRTERRSRGVFYTPAPLASELAVATLAPLLRAGQTPGTLRVCDPAVGGGALLLAAARFLIGHGGDPAVVVGNMTGIDIDPVATRLAAAALRSLGGEPTIRVGDALGDRWPEGHGYDAVVANPPFLAQLKQHTARSREEATALVDRFGEGASGYADTASLFLLLSLELVRAGGRIGILLPEPVIATRDGARVRRHVGSRSRMEQLSSTPAATFDAGVRVRLAVLEPLPPGAPVAGGEPWPAGEWSLLTAAPGGAPAVELRTRGVLGDVARATAGFRDEFYGLAAVAVDQEDPGPVDGGRPALLTCGLIDPARSRWGTHAARLAGSRFLHPRADLARLAPGGGLRTWADGCRVPKVLLATQTRVLEAVADPAGDWLAMVPVISVTPAPDALWHVLAVLLAPPVSAHARRLHAGAALSADAIKLSARQVMALPLPCDRAAWDEGADQARSASLAGGDGPTPEWRAALDRLGTTMCDAYGTRPDTVMGWWSSRLDRLADRT